MQRGLEPPSNGTDSKKGDAGDAAQGPSEVSRGSTGVPCTLAESSRGKVLTMLAEPVEGGRHTYTPQYAPDKAWNTPRVYVRFHPSALVPAALCVHAATLAQAAPLWGKLDFAPERGAGSRNNVRQRSTRHNSSTGME